MNNVLVIGSSGQLGSVLVHHLRNRYGTERVISTDIRQNSDDQGIFITADATNYEAMKGLVDKYRINHIYHLAAILSANGEKDPMKAWDINMKSFLNVLEVARGTDVSRVFFPSSIAVFGKGIDRVNTPQDTNLVPSTVYGISKVAGETWASYYHQRFGLDVRSIRYPGIIGYQSAPGGGTTDYAVDIFHAAVQGMPYKCFLAADTMLPMIYMEDAIRATVELMEAPEVCISIRTGYNLAGMSFTPRQLVSEIRKFYGSFEVTYVPDFRQQIADTWPASIDDSLARKDWGWKPSYNIEDLAKAMILHLQERYQVKEYGRS